MARGRRITMLWLVCLATLLAVPGSAAAQIGIESFSFGLSTAQAGAHPDLHTTFAFEDPGEPETAAETRIDLAPGFWLDSGATPQCVPAQFSASNCPVDTEVGTATVRANFSGSPHFLFEATNVYLLPQSVGDLARVGFVIPHLETPVEAAVFHDANDGGLHVAFEELPAATPIAKLELDLWGVPSSPAHDEERGLPGNPGPRPVPPGPPFIRNPTACEVANTVLSARSYEDPNAVATSMTSGPAITGCSKVPSQPSLNVDPTSTETGSASGLDVELVNPQDESPQGLSTSDLKAVALDLDGLEIDRATVSTHSACSPTEFGLDTNAPVACPTDSRLGTFAAVVPAAEERLEGSAYLGGDDGSGNYQIFLAASNSSLELKSSAVLEPGSEPWLVLPHLPQVPLQEVVLQIDPSAALFTTSPECGIFADSHELETWSEPSAVQVLVSAFTIDSGPDGGACPVPSGQPKGSSGPVSAKNLPASIPSVPAVTFHKRPPHRGHDRTPSFSFTSSVSDSTFRCKVDRRPWRPCRSPLTLRMLALGGHAFRVKAIAPDGAESRAVSYRFILTRG